MELRYRGLLVRMSKDAIKNMHNLELDRVILEDLLECGTDYRDTKMSKGEVGLAITRRGALLFVKLVPSYAPDLDERVWLVKHLGVTRREG